MTRMRLTLVHGMVASLILAGTVLVSAHMKLEKSEPAEGSTVTAAPADVQLFFSETPDAAVSKLELRGPVETTKLVGMHVMNKSLMATVQGEMPDGAYRVQWQAAGTDGHVQKGEVKFVVKRAK